MTIVGKAKESAHIPSITLKRAITVELVPTGNIVYLDEGNGGEPIPYHEYADPDGNFYLA